MIIIEDGTGVANANSYITLADALTQAIQMGLDFTNGTEEQLIQGVVEINKYSLHFLSTRTYAIQAALIDFPRNAFTDNNGFPVASDEIPQGVISAQVQAAVDVLNGYSVYGTTDGKNVSAEEVVGAVKVAYFNNGTSNDSEGGNRSLATINYLKPYIAPSSDLVGGSSGEMLVNY